MSARTRLIVLWSLPVLWCLVLASASGVIWVKYRSREMFVELEKLNSSRDALDAEWGRLQLEQSSLYTYATVERSATEHLHMRMPDSAEIQVVAP